MPDQALGEAPEPVVAGRADRRHAGVRGDPGRPWPKSIPGLCPLENLWFSRELRSRHLIREVQQAVINSLLVARGQSPSLAFVHSKTCGFHGSFAPGTSIREVQQAVITACWGSSPTPPLIEAVPLWLGSPNGFHGIFDDTHPTGSGGRDGPQATCRRGAFGSDPGSAPVSSAGSRGVRSPCPSRTSNRRRSIGRISASACPSTRFTLP